MRGQVYKTPERVAEAAEMRADGKLLREIAEHFGVRVQTIDAWLQDPDGVRAKQRKDSYRGECLDCGAPTNGSDGPGKAHERCVRCAAVFNGAKRKVWTRGRIIDAIREWAAEHDGDPPASADWNPYQAEQVYGDAARAQRWYDAEGRWPSFMAVYREHGTWNAAIRAAGFEPRANHGGAGNEFRRRSAQATAPGNKPTSVTAAFPNGGAGA